MLRRAAFAATLATGFGLTASAVHGLSGIDRSLQLAAVTQERPAYASDTGSKCDRHREPARLT